MVEAHVGEDAVGEGWEGCGRARVTLGAALARLRLRVFAELGHLGAALLGKAALLRQVLL